MRNGVSPWRWYFIGGAAAELAFSVMVMVMVMVVVMARWSHEVWHEVFMP